MKKPKKIFRTLRTHFKNIFMETRRIFLMNLETTFEKLPKKYELFIEKLWGNMRLTLRNYKCGEIALKFDEILKKFGKVLGFQKITIILKMCSVNKFCEETKKSCIYWCFPKKLENYFPELLETFWNNFGKVKIFL